MFCPSPPLLIPAVAAGAAAELDDLRAACATVIGRLLDTAPDEIVVVGTGPGTGWFRPGATGGLAGYGVPVTATLPGADPAGGPPLPLALTIGAWLLAGAGVPCSAVSVGPGADPAELAAGLGRAALLVVGDGSARRSEAAPGYVDPRAAGFDAAVGTALRTGAAATLRDLDPGLGADLLAAGVPAWRVAGHAATGPYEAELLYDAAPYGVGYFVAAWT